MLTNHPFLSGRPGRVETLRRLIEHALERGDVDIVTAGEVADRVLHDPDVPRRRLRPVEIDPAVYPTL
jgi:peptidoglycan/xylan/chitin deacetylase (PgdA/CDA1 family)